MRQDIRLFLGDREVEFSKTPQILFNYTETDLHNPVTVKNTYTKSITLEGTKLNCDALGHFYRLDRYQDYGGDMGAGFNPMTKTDFSLYVGGALYEKGYFKLTGVERDKSGNYNFQITLYGMLGSFFSRLTYQMDSENDAKLTLADLDFNYVDDGIESTLEEWQINKDEVYNAWGTITGDGEQNSARYRLIQYVPTYGGTAENFDNEKVMVNLNDFPSIVKGAYNVDGTDYKGILNGSANQYGYALGEYDGDLTPWVTTDLRSYLMQPAVRMKYIIDACKNPALHGFEVDLDSHFFNGNNPYYTDSFVTLGSFASLDLHQTNTQTITGGASLVRQSGSRSGDLFNVTYTGGTLSKLNNAKLTLRVGFTPSDTTSVSTLYTDTEYQYSINQWDMQRYESAGGCIVQLWAMDASNNIVASSNAYLLSSTKRKAARGNTALWWNYYNPDELDYAAPYTWVEGVWKKKNGSYVFCNRDGDTVDLTFTLNTTTSYHHLVMKIKWPYTYSVQNADLGSTHYGWYFYPDASSNPNLDNFYEVNPTGFPMYSVEKVQGNSEKTFNELLALNRVRGSFNYTVMSFEIEEQAYGNFLSNAKLSKRLLLGGDKTPADYLISFAKMFNLYFYYDSTEEASDPDTCPNGVIHIMDRNSFFTEEVENIDDLIDYSKKTTITPTVANSKWLSFDLEQIDSQVNDDYVEKYGYNYGRMLVNTSYNYDLGTTNLYDGNAFKGGAMVRESNSLYKLINYEDTSFYPELTGKLPYFPMTGRFTYKLFHKSGTEYDDYEFKVNKDVQYVSYNLENMNNLGLKNYDCFPKLQAHTDDNSPSDGSGVLLFLNGALTTNSQYGVIDYYITDDVSDMAELNEETPCYILTQSEYDANGTRIARKINRVPNFTRDLIVGGQQEGYIVHSWNFGHPQETFVPNVFSTEGDSIYDKMFSSYIRDMFDTNNKIYTAYVKLDNVNAAMLRKYYWFSNAIWRLNKIKDYDCTSYDTTQCEFIKVQDIENYKLAQISAGGAYRLTLDNYTIGHSGGTISGTVYLQSGGRWNRGDTVHIEYLNGASANTGSSSWISPSYGTGTTSSLSVSVPANPSAFTRYITIYVEYEDYPPMTATITQTASGAAPYLEFVESLIDINADGGYIGSAIQMANLRPGIVATTDSDWITDISINEGTGQMTASVAPNSGYARTGHITISATGINGTYVSDTAQIDQAPGGASELFVQPPSLEFDYLSTSGGTIYVTYGGTWTITTQDE